MAILNLFGMVKLQGGYMYHNWRSCKEFSIILRRFIIYGLRLNRYYTFLTAFFKALGKTLHSDMWLESDF